jgi:hypothetical protein
MEAERVLTLVIAIPLFVCLIFLIFARRLRGVREYNASDQRVQQRIDEEANFMRRTHGGGGI